MKKIYTVLLSAIVMMLCGFGAKAADTDLTLILNVDNENAVEYRIGYGGTYQALSKGENAIVCEANSFGSYSSIYVRAKDPFKLQSVKCDEPLDNRGIYSGEANIYPASAWLSEGAPRVYNVTTLNLDEARSAAVTVNVASGANGFTVTRNGGDAFKLSDGENIVKFDPATESPIVFQPTTVPFHTFTVDGTAVEPDYNLRYSCDVKGGEVIEVDPVWPEKNVMMTINISDDTKDAIKSLSIYNEATWSSTPVDFKVNTPFEVASGQYMKFEFDSDNFEVNSVTVDGQQLATKVSKFFIGENDVTVDIDASVLERFSFIIDADADNAVEVSVDAYNSTWTTLKKGSNVVYPSESYWGSSYNAVKVRALDGFKLLSIKCDDPVDEVTVPADATAAASLNVTSSWEGRVYKIETLNYDDVRTASYTLNITDSYYDVLARRPDNTKIGLKTGENTVKFDPATESELRLSVEGASRPLYSVKHNGTKVDYNASMIHEITLADGDVIEVTSEWPAKDVDLVINLPEDSEGLLKSVKYGSWPSETTITDVKSGEPVAVPCGKTITIALNSSDFQIESVKVNGDEATLNYGDLKMFVGEEAVTVDVAAHKYGTLHYTLKVNDYEHLVYRKGSSYATPIELTASVTEDEIDEKSNSIYIKAASEYCIASVNDAEGNPIEISGSGEVKVKDNMEINVDVQAIVYDGQWALWVEDINDVKDYWDGSKKSAYYYKGSDSTIYLTEENDGYTHIAMSTMEKASFYVTVTLDVNKAYGYINEELIPAGWSDATVTKTFVPENGDVLRVYTKGVEPELCAVEFSLVGDGAAKFEGAKVVTDYLKEREGWKDGLSLLEKTPVTVVLPEGAGEASVKLDGEALEADENGNYSFIVSAPHKIEISSASGIAGVDADGAAQTITVYNLQGIKLLDNASKAELKNLPAGLYIINGQKQVVR